MLGVWIGIAVIAALIVLAFIKANLRICHPNEILVFSGRKRKLKDGTVVGYRVIKGGRGLKIPIIESVTRLPLTTIPIDLELSGALTSGIIPINLQAMANVKIAGSEEEGLSNALERFLGRNITDISQIARENLEGSLRGVLATLTPEEANNNRLEFAEKVAQQARSDLRNLGLVLDTFKIKHISDNEGYLEAIGRKKNAEVRRDAKIVEANAEAEAMLVAAEAKKKGRVAEHEADVSIVEAENKLRVRRADLAAEAHRFEARANVAGEIVRIEEEQKLEEQRVEMNKHKYEADVVVPARAEKDAMELKALGKAANIIEDGKAMAEAVRSMRQEWEKEDTRELFLIQQLPDILDKITRVVAENLSIDKVTVVDSGNGNGVPAYVHGVTGSIVSIFEQIKNATGLDIPEILQTKGKGTGELTG
ncbi:MAG: flotillin family protein [Desulfobacterales bacterium]|nr:flotillin family protein [Desulfobacterales bacterium]